MRSAFAILLAASATHAGTPLTQPRISGDLGVDFMNSYVSYGISIENQGLVVQPYADLCFPIFSGDGALTKVCASLGIWNSLHTHRRPFVSGAQRTWYEFDFLTSIAFAFGKITLSPQWAHFTSPNGSFPNGGTLALRLDYDDSERLGPWALKPHALALMEIAQKTGSGPRLGNYWELGISPSYNAGPIALSATLTVGLGSGGFYGGPVRGQDTFGFFSAGLAAEMPLGFIPAALGNWALKANTTYFRQGHNAATASNETGRSMWVFGSGIIVRF